MLASPVIFGTLTRLQCCPPTCGAAAAILVSAAFARKHQLDAPVAILAQAMTTDFTSTFDEHSMLKVVGYDMTAAAARQVYEAGGIGPDDIDVVELHDCFTTNELITYEALGLTPEGTAEQFICDGDNTYGGRVVTNPSGGLLSKGHPLGATGLAQCAELVWQLRGQAGPRQVPTPASPCNTTSASAAPASSPSTAAPDHHLTRLQPIPCARRYVPAIHRFAGRFANRPYGHDISPNVRLSRR